MAEHAQSKASIPVPTNAIERIRRNHGLEHATIHLLSSRHRGTGMAGRSDARGFVLIGNLPSESIEAAVNEALERMRNGETQLAVHPNCGTNFVTAGIFGALAAFVGMWGVGRHWYHKLERLPLVVSLVTLALILSQPLGIELQRSVTTSSDVGSMQIVSVTRRTRGRMVTHRINTTW